MYFSPNSSVSILNEYAFDKSPCTARFISPFKKRKLNQPRVKSKSIPLILFPFIVKCDTLGLESPSLNVKISFISVMVETKKLKRIFEIKKNSLSESHKLYFDAIINKVFNQPEASNQSIEKILRSEDLRLNDTLLNNLYLAKLSNHINLYEYSKAVNASIFIQKNYLHLNDSSDIEMLQNEINIWSALKDVPKQEIVRNNDCTFPMYRDKVGLFNVDVNVGDNWGMLH